MLCPVLVVALLLERRLLVEQTLREGVVLSLDALCFPLSGDHVERGGPAHVSSDRNIPLLLDGWSHRAPFAGRNLNKLVQQDLVVFVNVDVALVGQESLRLLALFAILFEDFADFTSGIDLAVVGA